MNYDAAIVGAGPAGLQCALLLARARRSVALIDNGQPRNRTVRQAHGFLSRDGASPHEILQASRDQLAHYENVHVYDDVANDIRGAIDAFVVELDRGDSIDARRVVIATGMRDMLPEIDGLAECWGKSAFVCPYCDGWEIRDRPIAVWGDAEALPSLARELEQWTADITTCAAPVRRLRHDDGAIRAVEYGDGTTIACEALFMSVPLRQVSNLAPKLGCKLTPRDHIDVDACYRTSVPGVSAIGDCVTHMHQIVFSAASGARAAIAINEALAGIGE